MRLALSTSVLCLVTAAAGCGSGTPRTLESVIASPATADAQNFPNGKVQFTPTGIFNKTPTRVTPLPNCSAKNATGACLTAWSVSPDTLATIDQNGLAQCISGQSGTATIQIAVAGDGPFMNAATLTCP